MALALSKGTFDGLTTTNETVASASPRETHVKTVPKDQQTFNSGLPLLGSAFWQRPSAEHQALLTDPAKIDAVRNRMPALQVGLGKQWRMTPDIAAQALADAG